MGNNDKKIITISREFGSGGRLIGKRLAEKLDVPSTTSSSWIGSPKNPDSARK